MLNSLDPFLANLNPVISYLDYYQTHVTDFLMSPPAGISGTLTPEAGQPAARHSLRQLGYITEETLAFYQNRLPTNRGNGYLRPLNLISAEGKAAALGGLPSFDCNNTGDGERVAGRRQEPAGRRQLRLLLPAAELPEHVRRRARLPSSTPTAIPRAAGGRRWRGLLR